MTATSVFMLLTAVSLVFIYIQHDDKTHPEYSMLVSQIETDASCSTPQADHWHAYLYASLAWIHIAWLDGIKSEVVIC